MTVVALYNLALFSMLPIGFYLNGHLLKRISIKRLYFAGALFRALAIALLIFSPHITNLYIIFFGMCLGLLSGIFWSNRNLLNVKLTNSQNRIYFTSLDFISGTVTGILIPMLIGWFIMFGKSYQLYTPVQGYYAVTFITIAITILLGKFIKKINVTTPDITKVIHRGACFKWNCARGVAALFGLVNGIFAFFPVLLVMTYLGKEDTLGIVQSVTAVITGILMYSIARSISNRYRLQMIAASIGLSLFGALFMSISFTPLSIFIFIALITMSQTLLYTAAYAVIFDLIDRENTNRDDSYAYVFDIEMFLNVGRVAGILLFFYFIYQISTDFALRYTPLIFGIVQIAIVYLTKTIEANREVPAISAELAQAPANENQNL